MAMIGLASQEAGEEYDGSMFGPRIGTWGFYSSSDPRWRISGRGSVGFTMHPDAKKELKRLRRAYGKPPKDLEYYAMKD